jgi:hypothetical protein
MAAMNNTAMVGMNGTPPSGTPPAGMMNGTAPAYSTGPRGNGNTTAPSGTPLDDTIPTRGTATQ